VGAGVEADLVSVGLEHGSDHGASAALTFSSGNVHGSKTILGIAQPLKQGPHTLEVEILRVIADDAKAFEIAEGGKKS